MDPNIIITFHEVDHSDALEKRIRTKVDNLLRKHKFIEAIRVTVDMPHHHKHKGNLYQIRIDAHVAGKEVMINKQPGGPLQAHEDPYTAVNSAFKAATKALEKYTDKRQGKVKHHGIPLQGKIVRLEENKGYIETPTYPEIPFDEHVLSGGAVEDLKVGDFVTFSIAESEEKIIYATGVRIVTHPL